MSRKTRKGGWIGEERWNRGGTGGEQGEAEREKERRNRRRRRRRRRGGEKREKEKEDKQGHPVNNVELCIYMNTHVSYVSAATCVMHTMYIHNYQQCIIMTRASCFTNSMMS